MWPFDMAVRQALCLPADTAPRWAVFDADWYRAAYPDFAGSLVGDALLILYLDFGQRAGHSPNRYFDEAWHRRAYPAIQALVEAGEFSSAFDSYCRAGNLDRSPHWLFDEGYYRQQNPDLTEEALRAGGLANGYDHFLRYGDLERRSPHTLFDPAFYRSHLTENEQREAGVTGYFRHYLDHREPRQPERRTSCYFDPVWYLNRYPLVAAAIKGGTWGSALEHYSCNDEPTAFDPLPEFSEAWYLREQSGLREVIRHGEFRNGYAHFLRHGVVELRSPSEAIDLASYSALDRVRSELADGTVPNAFAHLLSAGTHNTTAMNRTNEVRQDEARALYQIRAADMLLLYGRQGLHFPAAGSPALSIVLVADASFAMTMMTLAYLRNNIPPSCEVIVIDPGRDTATRKLAQYVSGIAIIRIEAEIAFTAACNAGITAARGDAVLLLRDGAELIPGAIAAALKRLQSDPRIGAVGAKITRPHAVLAQAGGVVRSDGSLHDYMRDASPMVPEANFMRDVHFSSLTCLMVRGSVLKVLDGLNASFRDGEYASADLCLRIGQAGHRVVYDPAVMVWFWGADSVPAPGDQTAFHNQHEKWLAQCPEPTGAAMVLGRMADRGRLRVLLIEDSIPLRSIGSGFVRSNDIVRTMAQLGCAVTVFPINDRAFALEGVYCDFPDSVEVMTDHTLSRLQEFLLLRQGYYDAIWVCRTHNLDRILPALAKLRESVAVMPRVILDTEAIDAMRFTELAALTGEAFDLPAALRDEFAHAGLCQATIAVNAREATILRDLGLPDVHVIGHARTLAPGSRPFSDRSGLLFVGAIHRIDSPNYDSLCWMIEEVLPIVEQSLGWETRLTIAGYTAPGVNLDRFRSHPRVTLRGALPDLEPLYASHRVFVAPTRYAAGIPYKVQEAASFGLPIVSTELLSRQLGWEAGEALLAAPSNDAAGFAALVVALYRDEALWSRLRAAALARLHVESNYEQYQQSIQAVLSMPGALKREEY